MRLRKTISWAALLGTSFGLHAVGFAKLNGMGGPTQAKVASKPAFMEMTSAPKPAAPAPDPPPATEKPAPRALRRVADFVPRSAPSAEAPARAAAAPPAAETPADFSGTTLTVSIDKDGHTFLDAEAIDEASLQKRVRAAHSADPETRAVIAADGRVNHAQVVRVIDLLRREDVTKFAFNVDPDEIAKR